MLKLLHIAHDRLNPIIWTDAFCQALEAHGTLTLVEQGASMDEAQRLALMRASDVLLLGWGAASLPPALAQDRGALRYICSITGTIRQNVPLEIVASGVPVTNWGDAPAASVAEGAMTLLLAALKDLHYCVQTVRRDGWRLEASRCGGSIEGLNVGLYGFGAIGRKFVELIRPFQPVLRVFDPYAAELPAGCARVATLAALFDTSEAIVIHAGLTPETRGSVTADLLRRLPRHGVVINTARGAIVDQQALFTELASGRLRAGLDVLEPDGLSVSHPARTWENCIFTFHRVMQGWSSDGPPALLPRAAHGICLENLRRFAAGEPLRFRIDPVGYARQT